MPTYNKITLNGTTLIDLSTDTVAVADDIASGKVGHLNTGATATGTHSGIGEVTFSGSLSITRNTNIWQYLGFDDTYSGDLFYIIVLRDLYVNNTKMDYASEYCVFFDMSYTDRTPKLPVADGNDDYEYYIMPLIFRFDNGAYIETDGDSLSAIITKIIKVQMA